MIFDIIKKRRSVFPAQYNQDAISEAAIHKILEAANWAPTHKKTEPWRFKVLKEKKKKALGAFLAKTYAEKTAHPKAFKIKKLEENPIKANTIIAICMQRDPEERIPEWEEIAATAMAVQNMWLCCTQLGIGAYWSSPGLIKYMDQFFNLKEGERCLGFFYMGHYDEDIPLQTRVDISEKTEWFS